MAFDIAKVQVGPLTGIHRLDSFVCSHVPIQEFCRASLAAANDARALRAFVATHDSDPRIVGYYYLSLSTLSHDEVGPQMEGDFHHVDAIPTVYLGMIGVDRRLMRLGIGKKLMADALARVAIIAENAGTYALTLDAVDEDAAVYYESKFDFRRFRPEDTKMYLAVQTIIALGLVATTDD